MKKRIGITYDLKKDWPVSSDEPRDANAEFDSDQTLADLCQAFESRGHAVERIGNVRNLLRQIEHLDVDIVFNICEGRFGRNRESQVPLLLEMYGIPFVGSDALSLGLTLDKAVAKKCFIAEGIPTPRFFLAHRGHDLKKSDLLEFPLIVKACWEGSSKSLSQNSRVTDLPGLKRQIELIHHAYQQPAIVEEFIRGTEFTVAVMGDENPQALPVVQVKIDGVLNLGDDFYTFSRLLTPDRVEYVCPAPIPEDLENRLKQIAAKAYQCVGCRDFGRVDFRVDEEGRPYVLEINPLPCLARNDVFYSTAKALGMSYEDMINRILEFGWERYNHSPIERHTPNRYKKGMTPKEAARIDNRMLMSTSSFKGG